jgi:hypothetical protein
MYNWDTQQCMCMVGTKIRDGSSQKLMLGGALSLLQSFKGGSDGFPESVVTMRDVGFTILLQMSFNTVDTSICIESHKI